jgi:septal ring factor EnvC (AmiA/AmiB activator)
MPSPARENRSNGRTMPHHRHATHPLSPVTDGRTLPRHWRQRIACGVAAALLVCMAGHASAAKATERAMQKRAAEHERTELQQKLADLKRDIDRTEDAKDRAADALAESEIAISQANRALRELRQEQAATEARLQDLSGTQAELAKTVDAQQQRLAQLLRGQYIAGNQDRVRLLLSGDNPNRISRELQYFGYLSQAQADMLSSLRANLETVEANQAQIRNAKAELDEIAQEARTHRDALAKEKAQRAKLLAQLSTKLASQRTEAGRLQRDEQRLAGLVDRLSKLIIEQQKAEAAREKARQERLARAERERQQASQAGNDAKINSFSTDATDNEKKAAKSLARNELVPETGVQEPSFPRAFAALRGKLRLPVKGDLIAKFGSKRSDGPSWKGLFIRTAEGAEVRAIAGGRVVFADWLRGFGNLIIVDHGSQYMTIYGNNEAVTKRVGDAVKTGDVIATAGNSGGNEESGLYFEMRFQGRVLDPLEWVTLR